MMALMRFLHCLFDLLPRATFAITMVLSMVMVIVMVVVMLVAMVVVVVVMVIMIMVVVVMVFIMVAMMVVAVAVMIAMVVPMATMSMREHLGALVAAFAIFPSASRMASNRFLEHVALRLELLRKLLRMFCRLLVQPIHFELGALVASFFLASIFALLDRRISLACFEKWGKRLWALCMTLRISAALFVTMMSFLLHVVPAVVLFLCHVITICFVIVRLTERQQLDGSSIDCGSKRGKGKLVCMR